MPSVSTHSWAVAELNRLNFDGDCDALAQYVEALIDNNRETENSDPILLRDRVNTEMIEFIGHEPASRFADALICRLFPENPFISVNGSHQ